MKKIFSLFASLFLVGLLFTSFSTSLDGRALVADEGAMPKGAFAKTVGYLPGDTIIVTNLTNGKNIDILVIGALDPSEGVAILLSPEAAELVGIKKGADTVVKITKRSGQLDEACTGTAVIGVENKKEEAAEQNTDENKVETSEVAELNGEKSAEEKTEIASNDQEATQETEASVESENTPAEEETTKDSDLEETAPSLETVPAETSEENLAASEGEEKSNDGVEVIQATEEEPAKDDKIESEKVNQEELSFDDVQETEEKESEAEVESVEPENLASEEAFENKEPVAKDEDAVEAEIPSESVAPENLDDLKEDDKEKIQDSASISEDNNEELISPVEKEELPQETEDSEAVANTENIPQEEDSVKMEAIKKEELPEEDLSKEEVSKEELPPAEETESNSEKIEAENIPSEEDTSLNEAGSDKGIAPQKSVAEVGEPESNDESYEGIILVPAESNPPEASADAENPETVAEESSEVSKDSEEDSKGVPVQKEENPYSEINKYTVESLNSLKSGKYYVQIAVLSDENNIKSLISKYGKKYPITLVPLVSKKGYQVLIGPIGMDEYGTVLNRFKNDGYKDSFLRKIK